MTERGDVVQGAVGSSGDLSGRTLGGRYHLHALLGQGGFGAVYGARHARTSQEVVVKVLRPHMASDPLQVKRFLNEAKAACQLSHPHTVRVFDFGQTDDGLLFMAMERLHGMELAEVVKSEAPLDPFRVIYIAVSVLKGLAEAHGVGLVHRDLKPGNIFLCHAHGEPDFVKIIDFGIAKSVEADSAEHDLTETGVAIGTPKYMSPEQGKAEPLDGRSDLYSLGVILYEALSGQAPFVAASAMGVIVKHLQEAPRPLHEHLDRPLPPGLGAVVLRALEKRREDRFEDADDMRAALEEVLVRAGHAVQVRGRALSAKTRRESSGELRPVAEGAGRAEVLTPDQLPTMWIDTNKQRTVPPAAPVGRSARETSKQVAVDLHQGDTGGARGGSASTLGVAAMAALVAAGGVFWWMSRTASVPIAPPSTASAESRSTSHRAVSRSRATQRGPGEEPREPADAAVGAPETSPSAANAKARSPESAGRERVAAPAEPGPSAQALVYGVVKSVEAGVRGCVQAVYQGRAPLRSVTLQISASQTKIGQGLTLIGSSLSRADACVIKALSGAALDDKVRTQLVSWVERGVPTQTIVFELDPPVPPRRPRPVRPRGPRAPKAMPKPVKARSDSKGGFHLD